jgi:hypothetical protein
MSDRIRMKEIFAMKKFLGLILGLALVTGTAAIAQDTPGPDSKGKTTKKNHKGGKKGKKSGGTTTPPPK